MYMHVYVYEAMLPVCCGDMKCLFSRHWAVIGYFILMGIVLILILIASLVRKVPFVVV